MIWTLGRHFATWEFLLAMNVLLLVLGCFLEVVAARLLIVLGIITYVPALTLWLPNLVYRH